jgi:spermidine/putrescine transport system ATP-binding protein
MNNGVIQQIDTPEDIYNEPKNAFVADFIGESNIIDGIMRADYKVMFSNTDFECLDKGFSMDESVDVVIRPEDVRITPTDEGDITGTIKDITFKGVHYVMLIESKGDGFVWNAKSTQVFPIGSEVGIVIVPDAIHIMKKVAA